MLLPILQALLVTFLWSTSWVLVKWGLEELPPITFAGLRYMLAFLLLLLWLWREKGFAEFRRLKRSEWGRLLLLGLVYYALTQGAIFLGLSLLPANTLSLILSLSGVTIAVLGLVLLKEKLNAVQWLGVIIAIGGAVLYFGGFGAVPPEGLGVGSLAVLFGSVAAIMGRAANRSKNLSPLLITTVSMGAGAAILLASGLAFESIGPLSIREWAIIFWLAAVNTAFAFTLWNHTLRSLTAAQSGVINNTMLIQIALLAWVFLGERINAVEVSGLLLAALGTVLVQLRKNGRSGTLQQGQESNEPERAGPSN